MRSFKTVGVLAGLTIFMAGTLLAGEKTCCQKVIADKKECAHKCCIAAHKDGKSCQKCNPNKEDAKLIKKKSEKSPDKRPA